MDKYDEAIAYLMQFADDPEKFNQEVYKSWKEPWCEPGGALFLYCSPTGSNSWYHDRKSGSGAWYGCLTQVKSHQRRAFTLELTRRIEEDEVLPESPEEIKPEHLPRFAYWQREMDRTIRQNLVEESTYA